MTSNEQRMLIIMRHAKTEGAASSDQVRQLTDRGKADAVAAGRWLAATDLAPDHVLVSSATRAQQTLDHLVRGLGAEPTHEVVDELYGADAAGVLELCRALPAASRCALVIGHNPTMAELVQLVQREPTRESHLPTSGLVAFSVPGGWPDLVAGTAERAEEHLREG